MEHTLIMLRHTITDIISQCEDNNANERLIELVEVINETQREFFLEEEEQKGKQWKLNYVNTDMK